LANNPRGKNYLKYSGLAVQFVVTILLFVYVGRYLDGQMELEKPWFTLSGALIGVVGSMGYLIFKVK